MRALGKGITPVLICKPQLNAIWQLAMVNRLIDLCFTPNRQYCPVKAAQLEKI